MYLPIPNSLTILSPYPSQLVTINPFSNPVSLFLFCKYIHLCHIFLESAYKGSHSIFFHLCSDLTSLSVTISRFIHIDANGIISFFGLPWWLRWIRIYLQCRRPGFDPWVGKIPWRREWQPVLQYSCLKNSMDRGAWQAAHGVTKSWT